MLTFATLFFAPPPPPPPPPDNSPPTPFFPAFFDIAFQGKLLVSALVISNSLPFCMYEIDEASEICTSIDAAAVAVACCPSLTRHHVDRANCLNGRSIYILVFGVATATKAT